jgi:formylglycine-generating enzyme required for sulfatase activity
LLSVLLGVPILFVFIFLWATGSYFFVTEDPRDTTEYRQLILPGTDDAPPDVTMVRIEGGVYRFGKPENTEALPCDDPDTRRNAPEIYKALTHWAPRQRTVRVASLLLATHPVTAADYGTFLNSPDCPTPKRDAPFLDTTPTRASIEQTPEGYQPRPGFENAPASAITQAGAEAYLAWRSARDGHTYRLPTEEEWEFVAGGRTGQMFPWGCERPLGRAYYREHYTDQFDDDPPPVVTVGLFPEGASLEGIHDLMGNGYEICRTGTTGVTHKGGDLLLWNRYGRIWMRYNRVTSLEPITFRMAQDVEDAD